MIKSNKSNELLGNSLVLDHILTLNVGFEPVKKRIINKYLKLKSLEEPIKREINLDDE